MSDDASSPKTPPTTSAPAANGGYNEAMIRVLDDVEHVRTRPGMYIGGYNAPGLHQLVYEVVDNSIDEALGGYAQHVEVPINPDGSAAVIDDGRGVPGALRPHPGLPAVAVVLPL